jgi:hypothetical protein
VNPGTAPVGNTSTCSTASDEFSKVGRVPVYMTLTARRGDRPMRKVAASLFLSLAGAAEQPDEFVTDVDDATEANLRGVSR